MIHLTILLEGIMNTNDKDKLELDFSKSIEKKPESRNPYNINRQITPEAEIYYKSTIDQKTQDEMLKRSHQIQKNSVMLRLFVSSLLIAGFYFVLHEYIAASDKKMLHGTLGLIIYSSISYFFRPEPDMNNLGYFGGLINRPFDYSDDWNRFLLWLKIILLPGVIISESIVDFFNLFRS
jgi:hypothetical protein